jgi:hypothetical protein
MFLKYGPDTGILRLSKPAREAGALTIKNALTIEAKKLSILQEWVSQLSGMSGVRCYILNLGQEPLAYPSTRQTLVVTARWGCVQLFLGAKIHR